MVTIAQCNLPAEAHAMRVRLEAAGIPVFLADELTVAMDWLLSNAIGGVKVQVPERYVPRATRLLKGLPAPMPPLKPMRRMICNLVQKPL